MSLKVLLADDSAAIKKVVQLSLQDLGVELKTVGSGKEVLDVARKFSPDIAFIDVLLPQKSGYDVTSELKKDPVLGKVPVIMLWSAFMAFDEAKFKACGAQAKLEKPFDVGALRNLINEYVPKVAQNPFEESLDFPAMNFDQPIGSVPPPKKAAAIPPVPPVPSAAPAPAATTKPKPELSRVTPEWGTSAFQDINDFANKVENSDEQFTKSKPFELPQTPSPNPGDWGTGGDNEWVRKDLGKFKVPVPEDELLQHTDKPTSVSFEYNESQIVDTSFLFKPSQGAAASPEPLAPIQTPEPAKPMSEAVLSLEELSDLKKETRELIEKVVWKLVPELASQIIKDELNRLLSEEK